MSDVVALADLLRWAADYGHAYVHANADHLAVQILTIGAAPAVIVGLFTRYAPLISPLRSKPARLLWRLFRPWLVLLLAPVRRWVWRKLRPWWLAIKRALTVQEDGK